jgi:predicted NodU family carbamoyl transferase
MIILGINISHNFSICIYENKKIIGIYYEDRFVLDKEFDPEKTNFFSSIFNKINFNPELVIYSSYGRTLNKISDKKIISSIQKQLNNPKFFFDKKNHHIYHACSSFYFSNFSEAMAIVIDGGGATSHNMYKEIQSIFYINKKNIFKLFCSLSCFKFLATPLNFSLKELESISNIQLLKYNNGVENLYTANPIGGLNFSVACDQTNYPKAEGKLMGLSSYAYTDEKYKLNYNNVEVAKYVQEKTFKETCILIEKAYNYKKIKNFVLSGGYFLNCSNNFKYVKKYPNFNFFVDPDPSDGGTALGACVFYDNYK